jgi:hypothetical protein
MRHTIPSPRQLLVTLLFAVLPLRGAAQTMVTFQGTLTELRSGRPVARARVTADSLGLSVMQIVMDASS